MGVLTSHVLPSGQALPIHLQSAPGTFSLTITTCGPLLFDDPSSAPFSIASVKVEAILSLLELLHTPVLQVTILLGLLSEIYWTEPSVLFVFREKDSADVLSGFCTTIESQVVTVTWDQLESVVVFGGFTMDFTESRGVAKVIPTE
jgi:hypothetical protein